VVLRPGPRSPPHHGSPQSHTSADSLKHVNISCTDKPEGSRLQSRCSVRISAGTLVNLARISSVPPVRFRRSTSIRRRPERPSLSPHHRNGSVFTLRKC
jgi:hypothetical protein